MTLGGVWLQTPLDTVVLYNFVRCSAQSLRDIHRNAFYRLVYHSNAMAADTETFTELPILPLSQALDPKTKPQFLADLRSALLNVGFLYLSETGLPEQLVEEVIKECKGFFENLPHEEKERIEMKNQKSFLGWSRVSRHLLACSDLTWKLLRFE